MWDSGQDERGLLVRPEVKGEIEDEVADGNAQRKFAGAGVAGKPDHARGFLLRRERTGLQGKSERIGGIFKRGGLLCGSHDITRAKIIRRSIGAILPSFAS